MIWSCREVTSLQLTPQSVYVQLHITGLFVGRSHGEALTFKEIGEH